jgi:hypothetical protein
MSVTHRSISVATESSFGSIDTSSGLPSPSGLTFLSLPCEKDPIVVYGDPVVNERTEARDGPHGLPPEPDTVWSAGSRVQRRTGQVQVTIDFTTIGADANTYAGTGLGKLLNAGFLTSLPLFTSADTVVGDDVNYFTPTTTNTNYKIGGLVGSIINGRCEYSAVSSNDRATSGKIGVSPAFSDEPSTIYPMQTWYTPTSTSSGQVTSSLCFRVDGVNFRTYAYGCKLVSLNVSVNNGRLMGAFTFQAALIQDDHANATGPIEPIVLGGATQHFRNAYAVVSSPVTYSRTNISGSTGEELDRIALDAETFTFNITNTLTPKGFSNNILTMSDMEVTNVDLECNLTLSAVKTDIADDFKNRVIRQVLIGTGPIGNGQGMALFIPAAYLTVDPNKYDVGGEIVKQTLTYKQTRFGGDVGTTQPANTPIRLALGI